MTSDPVRLRTKSSKTTRNLWEALKGQPFPYLHELAPMDRDGFVLLDAYLRDCLEEWFARGGKLSARSSVLLDDCTRSIIRRWKLLDGEGQCYFGYFRRLARQILRGIDVRQAEQGMTTDLDWDHVFNNPLADFVALVEIPVGSE